jgi:hypothetical protein
MKIILKDKRGTLSKFETTYPVTQTVDSDGTIIYKAEDWTLARVTLRNL